MVQIHSPRPFFQRLTRDFWFFVYSAVGNFVGGQILKVQQALKPQILLCEVLAMCCSTHGP